MSTYVATDRTTPTRRLQIVGAVLAVLALVTVAVSLVLSGANSNPARDIAPTAARGHAAALAAPATFRDPVTHALLPITTQASFPDPVTHGSKNTFRDPATHVLLPITTPNASAPTAIR
jgi:hypothetical protein